MENDNLSGIIVSENRYGVLSESQVNKHGGQVNRTDDTRVFNTMTKTRHRGTKESIDLELFQSMNPDMKLNVLFEKINNVELSQDSIKHVNESVTAACNRMDVVENKVSENVDKITKLSYNLIHIETKQRQRNFMAW